MNQQALRPNLRSKVFTDDFREKLATGINCIRLLHDAGVKVVRTDYSGRRPMLLIDPQTAEPVVSMLVSSWSRNLGGGIRHIGKVIGGCDVVWTELVVTV